MRLLTCVLFFVVLLLIVGKETSLEEVKNENDQPVLICQDHLRYLREVKDNEKEILMVESGNLSPYYWWVWTEKIVFGIYFRVDLKKSDMKNKTVFCIAEYSSVPGFTGPQSVKLILEPERAGNKLKSPTGYNLIRAVVVDTHDPRTPEMWEYVRRKVKEMEPIDICKYQRTMITEALRFGNYISQLSMISVVVGPRYFAENVDPSLTFKEGKRARDHVIACIGSFERNGTELSFGMNLREDDESETGWMVISVVIQGEDREIADETSTLTDSVFE